MVVLHHDAGRAATRTSPARADRPWKDAWVQGAKHRAHHAIKSHTHCKHYMYALVYNYTP